MGTRAGTTRPATLLGALLPLALAGCGPAGGAAATTGGTAARTSPATRSSAPPSSSSAASSPGSPATSASSGGSSAGTWLGFRRTGGFAGVDDSVTVAPDGAVLVSRRSSAAHRFRLTPAETARLRGLADRIDVAAHAASSSTAGGTADAFSIVLTVDGRRLAVPEGRVPRDIAPLLTRLTALMTR